MINTHYNITDEDQQGKTFFSFDKFTLVLGSSLILGGVVLFKYNPFQVPPLRQLEPVAKIKGLEFESKRKIPGTLTWIDTIKGDTLYNGDQILTDEKASATVEFDAGSRLIIGPQSLIRIEVLNNEYQIQLVKGQLKVEGDAPAKIIDVETGKSVQVKSGEEIVSSKTGIMAKSEIQNILNDPKQGSVIDPHVTKEIDFTLKRNDAGTATLIDANGNKVATQSFNGPITIKTPNPGRYTLELTGSSGQSLGRSSFRVSPYNKPQLQNVATNRTYVRGEVLPIAWAGSETADYRVILKTPTGEQSVMVKGNKFSFPLNDAGIYGVQVALIQRGQEYPSDEMKLDIKLEEALSIPAEQLSQSVPVKSPADYNVKNKLNNSPVVFEVSPEQDFSQIVKKVPAEQGRKAIVMEKPGVYYVRAKSSDNPPLVSPPAKMVVTAPVAQVSKNYEKRQEISTEGKQATLSWVKPQGVREVKVQVAKDPNFQKLITEKDTPANAEIINLPNVGNYFWRVLPKEGSAEFLTPSASVPLEVALPKVSSPEIIAQQIIDYEEINGKPNHVIKLVPYKNAKNYTLEVFSDAALKKPVFKQAVKGTTVNWISNRSGKYYYRVKVQDVWGQESEYSKTGELIFPISPMVDL